MKHRTRALFVYPRFVNPSFWNLWRTFDLLGVRYHAPPLGLITVAAMLPDDWDLRLVDGNVEELTDADLGWADLVMTGGMLPQRSDALGIVERARQAGKPVVVGGPDLTSSPQIFAAADFRILGEAEDVIGAFVAAWNAGERRGDFVAPKFQANVRHTPIPRYDLVKLDRYLYVGVQFSRGCPFTCEFCDIIELFGRVPRTKTNEQVLAELDALLALGYRGHVDFVDDNLIGNKKAVKAFLPELVEWQRARGYPFRFSTEATINLADDPVLLDLMSAAGFFGVFVGIESPDDVVLRSTQKKQNTRRDMVESIDRIYAAGITVLGGFVLGFDEETPGVADRMIALIQEAAIPVCVVGLLYALPGTQLTTRLMREGRMYALHNPGHSTAAGDQCLAGLNFETQRPRVDILRDYRKVISTIYRPWAFFGRVLRAGRKLRVAPEAAYWGCDARDRARFRHFMTQAARHRPALALALAVTLWWTRRTNPAAVARLAATALAYTDFGPFSRYVSREITAHIHAIRSGAWTAPTPMPKGTEAEATLLAAE